MLVNITLALTMQTLSRWKKNSFPPFQASMCMIVVLKTLVGKISSTHVFIVIFNTVGLTSKNPLELFLHRICFLETSLLPTLVRSVTDFLSCQTIHICPPFTNNLGSSPFLILCFFGFAAWGIPCVL